MSRAYEVSHPWLTFTVHLDRAPATLWLLLGEAQSKCDHIAGVPLRPRVAQYLHQLYLVKGVQATTAIEGNTLTEQEVRDVLGGTLQVPQSKEYLAQEVRNIADACDSVVRRVTARQSATFTVEQIREFNRFVLRDLALPDHCRPGETRTYSVGVGTYRAAPAEDCDDLLGRLVEWLNGPTFRPPSRHLEIAYALIQAALAHLYLAWIHPFGDGNGRTARLMELQILMFAGASSPAAHLLSNHYNQTRTEYYRQLERASASGGDVVPFIEYAARGFVDGLRGQLDIIRAQQQQVAWESYVHERFDGTKSPADIRRRHLVLDIAKGTEPVASAQLRDVTPRVAANYARVSQRTFVRDVLKLQRDGLVTIDSHGRVSANKSVIQAFLPIRRDHHVGSG